MYNPYIIIPLVTWAIAQLAKFTIEAFGGRLDFRNLYATGGMPSVHSAVVASLATTAGLLDGLNSHLFGLTLVVSVIVIYDSLNVRRSSGDQAVALNLVIDSLNAGRAAGGAHIGRLREVLGHTPAQVTAGTILGVFLAGLFNYDRLDWLSRFFTAAPHRPELAVYGGMGVILLIAGLVLRLVLAGRARRLSGWRQLLNGWLAIGLAAAALEALFCFGALENASFLVWRFWTLMTMAVALATWLWLAVSIWPRLPLEAAALSERERKEKWFNPPKKKKRARR